MKLNKKRFFILFLSIILCLSNLAVSAEELPLSNATLTPQLSVEIKKLSSNSGTLQFVTAIEGKVYYKIQDSTGEVLKESDVLTGKQLSTQSRLAIDSLENLKPNTNYIIYALLESNLGEHSDVVSSTFDTTDEDDTYIQSTTLTTNRNIGTTFTSQTVEDHELVYKVLSESSTTNTGTVQVGDGSNSAVVGFGSDGLTIPQNVSYGNITYSVTKIADRAFMGNFKVSGVLTLPEGLTDIGTLAFATTPNLLGDLSLPSTLTSIGAGAFSGGSNFTKVNIPAGVTRIGAMAFNGCSGLDGDLVIPSKVEFIEDNAFKGCSNLDSLTLETDRVIVGISAFENCTNLSGSVIIHGNPIAVASNAFKGCKKLESAQFLGNKPSFGQSVFDNCSPNFKLLYDPLKSGWTGYVYSGNSIVNITPIQLLTLTGPATLTMNLGYDSTSTEPYYISGSGIITVEKLSGDSKITWNSITKKLDIAPGLLEGTYPVIIKASNGIQPDASFTFTLIIQSNNVSYLDNNGIERTKNDYTTLTSNYLFSHSSSLNSGWYLIDSTFSYNERIKILGDVHIIILDSAQLTANNGLQVENTNNISIYGQSLGTGKLIATAPDKFAAIGSGFLQIAGNITINGGHITATGGAFSAAIGSGDTGSARYITINGGTINAYGGSQGAAIGGGLCGPIRPFYGNIYINGGNISATGGFSASAIGGGSFSKDGSITITGGTINASTTSGGAGIGGGIGGQSGTITIKGTAVVNAISAMGGAGIGSGNALPYSPYDSHSPIVNHILITDSASVTAQGGGGYNFNNLNIHGGAGIGSGGAVAEGSSLGSVISITINTLGKVTATGGLGNTNSSNKGARIGTGGSKFGAGKEFFGIPLIDYIDSTGAKQTTDEYTVIDTHYLNTNDNTLVSGWYVADSNATYISRITISGTVNIILVDGVEINTLNGLNVKSGNTLNIYGQKLGTGKLNAGASKSTAAIGGDHSQSVGSITINGGIINTKGGSLASGIGSGNNGSGGIITVNKGTLASLGGEQGSAVGGGLNATGEIIFINGGNINATGGSFASAIGGGCFANGNAITISGGTINANATLGGAGIGGGIGGQSGTITIKGTATVNTIGGSGAAGIGSGGALSSSQHNGNSPIVNNILITDSASITAQGGGGYNISNINIHGGAGIGSGGAVAEGSSLGSANAITITTLGTVRAVGGSGNNSGANSGADIGEGGSKQGNGKSLYTITIKTQPLAKTEVIQGKIIGNLEVTSEVNPNCALSYEWFQNTENNNKGGMSTGVLSSKFALPSNLKPGEYYYYCVIKGLSTAVSSNVATITVTHPSTLESSGNSYNQNFRIDLIPNTKITINNSTKLHRIVYIHLNGEVKDNLLSILITEQMLKDAIKIAQADGKALDNIIIDFIIDERHNWNGMNIQVEPLAIKQMKGLKSFKLSSPLLNLSFDTDSIIELDRQYTENLNISVFKQNSLSPESKILIGNRPAFNISVYYIKNGRHQYITRFGKGKLAIEIPYNPTNQESKNNIFGVYVNDDGQPQPLVTSKYSEGKLIIPRNQLSIYGVGYNTPVTFTDTTYHWAKNHIDFVVNRGLISSINDDTFAPDVPINRSQFIMALIKLTDVDVKNYKKSSFNDVNSENSALPYIEWAVAHKIVSGTGNNQFSPNEQISRQDMAVMMFNFIKTTGYKLPSFNDIPLYIDDSTISDYAKEATYTITQGGLMQGKGNNVFDPICNATRGEVSSILYTLANKLSS